VLLLVIVPSEMVAADAVDAASATTHPNAATAVA
jgi:hypothetical protein